VMNWMGRMGTATMGWVCSRMSPMSTAANHYTEAVIGLGMLLRYNLSKSLAK
jgi:uncharacterized membrane protein YbhN (UPF0104 family)